MSQQRLSEVFPPECKPVRSGVYKTWLYDLFGTDSIVEGYSYYCAGLKYWFNTHSTPYRASIEYKLCRTGNQNKYWQGLLK